MSGCKVSKKREASEVSKLSIKPIPISPHKDTAASAVTRPSQARCALLSCLFRPRKAFKTRQISLAGSGTQVNEQVVQALIGCMHICEGLAETQLLSLACTEAEASQLTSSMPKAVTTCYMQVIVT